MRIFIGIAAVAILIIGVDLWAGIGGGAGTTFSIWPPHNVLSLPSALLVPLGIVIGACPFVAWIAFRKLRLDDPDTRRPGPVFLPDLIAHPLAALTYAIATAVTTSALLIVAVRNGVIDPVAAALTYMLGWLAALATVQTVRLIARGDGLSFDSYWGGLGGAQGGWRVSPLLVSIILALVLIGGTVAVGTGHGPGDTRTTLTKDMGDGIGGKGDNQGDRNTSTTTALSSELEGADARKTENGITDSHAMGTRQDPPTAGNLQ